MAYCQELIKLYDKIRQSDRVGRGQTFITFII